MADLNHLRKPDSKVCLCGVPAREGLPPLEESDPADMCRTCWRLYWPDARQANEVNQKKHDDLWHLTVSAELDLLWLALHVVATGEKVTELLVKVVGPEVAKAAGLAIVLPDGMREGLVQEVAAWLAHKDEPGNKLTPEQVERIDAISRAAAGLVAAGVLS